MFERRKIRNIFDLAFGWPEVFRGLLFSNLVLASDFDIRVSNLSLERRWGVVVCGGLYLVYLGIGGEWVGSLVWPAVAAHAVLTFLLARGWFKV